MTVFAYASDPGFRKLDLTEVNQPPMLIISKVMFCFWANLQNCWDSLTPTWLRSEIINSRQNMPSLAIDIL